MHRRALGLLLAATALPVTPLLAQAIQPATPPVVEIIPPPVVTAPAPVAVQPAPAPAPTMEPIFHKGAPAEDAPAASAPALPRTVVRAAPRAAPRPRATAPAPEAVVEAAPAPAFTPAPVTEAPAATEVAATPAPAPLPVEPVPPAAQPTQSDRPSSLAWLWLFGAALAAVAAILLFRRWRRPEEVHASREVYAMSEPDAVIEPAMAATMMAAPLAYETAPAAAAAGTERPQIEFGMRPVRAGVTENDAVVEFELTIDNQGSAPARDVRISTWMFPAGSSRQSEMESMLIEPDAEADVIGAGDSKSFETQVALPTSGIGQDSVLPVVVAEARYRLDDGSEARSSASFAVGVPLGKELAHFDLENPSGLHEGVEARPLETQHG